MKIIMDDGTKIEFECIETIEIKPDEFLLIRLPLCTQKSVIERMTHHLGKLFPPKKILFADDRFDFKKIRFIGEEE